MKLDAIDKMFFPVPDKSPEPFWFDIKTGEWYLRDEYKAKLKQWAREKAFNCIGKRKGKALRLPTVAEAFIDGYNQHRGETGAKIIKEFN